MDRKRRTRTSEACQLFTRRHRRGFHRRAGEDQGLRDLWHREFNAEAGGGGGIGRHARNNLIIDPKRLQAADLLGDGAVERGITGMDARHILAVRMRAADLVNDVVEGQ